MISYVLQVLHEMFFHALALDRAREYSVPWIEEYLHKKVIPCPDAAEHKNINLPLIFSH